MPSYLKLQQNGILRQRVELAYHRLNLCNLCPRKCGSNRSSTSEVGNGFCRTGSLLKISSYNAHFGEEPPISGKNGSGTIFFTHCNLRCVFCQNYPISQLGHGQTINIEQLADTMLELQRKKCHNINLVSPSIYIPQILAALEKATELGFTLPLVYNCSGYESVETLKLLDGIIDIYLPDAKYSDNAMAIKYSQAPRYVEVNHAALVEMHRQVGVLKTDKNGIAIKGLVIRHLVLPNNIAGSLKTLEFIATKISPDTFLSIMAQYHPAHKACGLAELSRRITQEEYELVINKLRRLNLNNGWVQELE